MKNSLELTYTIALNSSSISPLQRKKLLDHFQSFEEIFAATQHKLSRIEDIREETVKTLLQYKDLSRAERELEKAKKMGIHLLSFYDPLFPISLKNLVDSPCLLYVKGNLNCLEYQALAIVGCRKASFYGISVTSQFTEIFVKKGLAIISGAARGIDTQAHKTALENSGKTIAVLGCGVDIVYPPENKKLFDDISKEGCLISEFPLSSPPDKFNFPKRNRIISALSLGTLVVEAPKKSGALITAQCALEQGKEVFAVPGPILSPHYEGSNHLISQGAYLAQSAQDVLWILGIDKNDKTSYSQKSSDYLETLSEEERKILNILGEAQTADEIERVTALDIKTVQELLTHMQLEGYIKEVVDKKFIRAEEVST